MTVVLILDDFDQRSYYRVGTAANKEVATDKISIGVTSTSIVRKEAIIGAEHRNIVKAKESVIGCQ